MDWILVAEDFTCLSITNEKLMISWDRNLFVACILKINMIIINICFPYVFKRVLLIPRHSFHLIAYYCYCLLHIGLSEAKNLHSYIVSSMFFNWIATVSYRMLFDCHKSINIWKYILILAVCFTHLSCKFSSSNKNE